MGPGRPAPGEGQDASGSTEGQVEHRGDPRFDALAASARLRAVVALVACAVMLAFGAVIGLLADLLGAWARSPLRPLSPPARQELLRRVRGEEWTPPGGMAQARAAAAPGAQRFALLTLYCGLLLSVVAQAFLATSSVVVLLAGFGGLLLFWGLPLAVRASGRAARFADDHREP